MPNQTQLPLDAARYRGDFPILAQQVNGKPLVYFDNAATSQRPRQVVGAMVEVYEQAYSNVHRGIHTLSEQSTDLYEQAREKIGRFINARKSHEVIFTAGCTASINTVARSWGDAHVSAGDEIVVTEMDHHSNLVPWHQLAERTGAVVRGVNVTDEGLLDLESLDSLLCEKTKLVAFPAVSNVLGTVNPVEEIVRRARAVGAITLVDAAQSAPHQPTDVQAMGVDFFACSGHKMLGPSGVGVLWGREQRLDEMPPFLGGGSMIREVKIDSFTPADLPAKFEAGTPPIVPAIGLGAAADYLSEIGLKRIHQYDQMMAAVAHERLASVDGIRFLGPAPEKKAGIVSFVMEDVHAHDAAHVFDQYGVAVRAGHHCTMPLHKKYGISASLRASFYFYNVPEEIDRLVEAVAGAKKMFNR